MANILFDFANWSDWLVGTWDSMSQTYSFNGTTSGSILSSTYGGTINTGDLLVFDLTSFGSVSTPSALSVYINGVSVDILDISGIVTYPDLSYGVNPGDTVELRIEGGCCTYDVDIKLIPKSLSPSVFWTNFVGCHET